MFKHIIWDFDGTLFDTYPTITMAFKAALEEEGIYEPSEKIMSLMKITESSAVEYYMTHYGASCDIREKYKKRRKVMEPLYVKPFKNVCDVLGLISQAGKNNYLYTHRGQSSVEFLKAFDIYDYFTDFITKENNFKRKPDPEALLYLIDKHSIRPEEAVMVGDRDIDLMAARNAGISACFFDCDNSGESEVADFRITDMEQLIARIS